ncbi:benzoate 4-monooxygenase cytochrome P450, putative [Talaromyces stipitatus ATCC 10500]|uniref:Benzoate 4-monooxygenase cytochrome P450, putative n=1 Tax=Talaromyces stipitatus (strain ATCC 10500 / CBS 375.48 / QM 6759 / NRRL 1006) TaxID=441959 RepID=B8MGC9_TALSN|nr:benzoate 4-monooxygenase cytochrome P450, putative [Talaromyces stipitatus ATCC 10500]EED16249.1 benzoate 4-monooxygenase cytochrome P450, putative [Talaromyces stipitatus ATCC 10500]
MATLAMHYLKDALKADLTSTAGSVAILAVTLHWFVFRVIAVENHLAPLLWFYVVAISGVGYAYLTLANFSILQTLIRLAVVTTSFNASLILSIAVYRLFFHRIRRFPGPFWSKLSRFPDVALAAKEVRYYREVAKMRETYGDFIRTGPREICIVRKSAVPLIYGPQSQCLKTTWYAQVSPNPKKCSIHMTRDFDDHRKRRKAWDRGFSIKALATYEPRIKAKVDSFVSQIQVNEHKPLDATAWSMFLSFDIMGEVGFGKDFNNLSTGKENPAIRAIHEHMTVLSVLSHVPWLLYLISSIPGATAAYADFFRWCGNEIDLKQKTWNPEEYPQDIVSWLLKSYVEKDISASPSLESLHEDSRVVIIAGSETTATTLASIFFYLAKYPSTLKKLQHLLDQAMPGGAADWSYEKAKSVTFIDDIINETLRLKPALLTGGYRCTPAQGLQVDDVYIPGDINVFVPVQLIQTDERYYANAQEFIPERWGERKDEMATGDAPFFPFSLGAYSCPGKNLALQSLRIAISVIAQQYNVAFAENETGDDFDKNALDTFTTTLPPLQVQFSRR